MKFITKLFAVAMAAVLTAVAGKAQVITKSAYTNTATFTSFQLVYTDTGILNTGTTDLTTSIGAYKLGSVDLNWLTWNSTKSALPTTFSYTVYGNLDITNDSVDNPVLIDLFTYTFNVTNLSTAGSNTSFSVSTSYTINTSSLLIDGNLYSLSYTISTGDLGYNSTSIVSSTAGYYGNSVVISPAVPEPSTYALMGASGLMALVGVRRIRSKKKTA